jgi:hypothetical protein
MLKHKSLSDIIQSKLSLAPANARGFHDVRCQVCGDTKSRGGFKFDGSTTGYSCYNCGVKFKYEEETGKLSRNARQVLEAFGITPEDLTELRSPMFVEQHEENELTLQSLKQVKLFTPEVALPDGARPIGSAGNEELQLELALYLESRKIDALAVRAHYSTDPRYLRRVIIPFYRDGKVIYWQARAIDKDVKRRYINCSSSRDAVMYGYDEIFSGSSLPLFVTEGVFDAISLNGVCILGSSLNEAKIEILKRTRRRIIFVIDRDQTGGSLGQQVLAQGWELSFVDPRVSDANASVVRFGLPYTIYTLLKNSTSKQQKDASRIMLDLGVLEGKLRNK